jgi:hypothetical protein
MTLVVPVVTCKTELMRLIWVSVTKPLLVESIVDVSVVPVAVRDTVVTLTVEVDALATAIVLVRLVLTVETLKTVVETVWVVSGTIKNVTWNETGKLGIVKLQTYPAPEPQDTPLVNWYPETFHPDAGVATIETDDPINSWQPLGHDGVS